MLPVLGVGLVTIVFGAVALFVASVVGPVACQLPSSRNWSSNPLISRVQPQFPTDVCLRGVTSWVYRYSL